MRCLPLLAAAFCFVLSAQEHPDFTGTWKLNIDESDFAGLTPPKSRTDVIEQSGNTLRQNVKEMDAGHLRTSELHYELDGSTTQNTIEGNPVQSTAKWDVSDLVIHSVTHGADDDVAIDDRWVMSLDKTKFTIRRHFEGRGLQWDQALVEYRQQ
jgi:hypothetical protein